MEPEIITLKKLPNTTKTNGKVGAGLYRVRGINGRRVMRGRRWRVDRVK